MFSFQRRLFEPTLPVNEETFYALVRDKESSALIDGFRQSGDAKLKRKLPAFIFQATFDETTSKSGKVGAWRKQAATRLTGLVVMDIDHVENPLEVIEHWKKTFNFEELGIVFIYITPSGHGIKVVFIARLEWGNLIDNQHRMAELLGVEVDESCKDASRMSFICKEEDIAYLDKQLFSYENPEFAKLYEEEYRGGRSAATTPVKSSQDTAQPNCELSIVNCELPSWRSHDVQSIINARYEGKLPCAAQSNRHAESLKLATDLLILLDGDKQAVLNIVKAQPWVQEIIRERNENVEQTVQSAAECIAQKERKYTSPAPSKEMQDAILKATGKSYKEIIGNVHSEDTAQPNCELSIVNCELNTLNSQLESWGKEIEALFAYFPILSDICRGLKHNQFPAALFVAGSFLMTLMTRCTYRFYHRPEELRRLNSSTIIVGDPASGKSFATRLYKLLMAPIFAADKAGKAAINAYRELMKTKGGK